MYFPSYTPILLPTLSTWLFWSFDCLIVTLNKILRDFLSKKQLQWFFFPCNGKMLSRLIINENATNSKHRETTMKIGMSKYFIIAEVLYYDYNKYTLAKTYFTVPAFPIIPWILLLFWLKWLIFRFTTKLRQFKLQKTKV